jgi:hypothetical protein
LIEPSLWLILDNSIGLLPGFGVLCNHESQTYTGRRFLVLLSDMPSQPFIDAKPKLANQACSNAVQKRKMSAAVLERWKCLETIMLSE